MNKIHISLILCAVLCAAKQKDGIVFLDTISVTATNEQDISEQKIGETKISDKTLSKRQVADQRDFVRYQTGVSAVESGRFGTSGYAIRGVDENRVGIQIDGLRQAEVLSSSAFNELYAGYGNFNNTRNSIEFENVKTATITKGADGVKSGSGALGGSVMFETKDARDFLVDKDYYFGFKNGFASRDSSNFKSITTAGKFSLFDILLIHTNRKGNELKNYFYDPNDKSLRAERESTDPYHITKNSTMVKLGFTPHEEHRFSVIYDDSKQKSKGQELSYNLNVTGLQNGALSDDIRYTNDKTRRKNIAFAYENFTQNPFWDYMKITYQNQKITTNATNIEGNQNNPAWITDPNQMQLKLIDDTYTLVDKYDKPISIKEIKGKWSTQFLPADSKGDVLKDVGVSTEIVGGNIFSGNALLDCAFLSGGCDNKKIRVWVEKNNKKEMGIRNIEKITIDGKEYGKIAPIKANQNDPKPHDMDMTWDQNFNQVWGVASQFKFVTPKTTGYHTGLIWDRDLNTDTKQLNLDFEKEFNFLATHNFLKYGGGYEKIDKSMVNRDRFGYFDLQWWKSIFVSNNRPNFFPGDVNLKTMKFNDFTYLIPVQTKIKHLYIDNAIEANDWLELNFGYRYDDVKMQPKYTGQPEVPRGIITGIFKPYGDNCNPYDMNSGGYYSPECDKSYKENLHILTQQKNYKGNSYNIGLNLDPFDFMRFQIKHSNAFRAPTSDELYMTFKFYPSFLLVPNIDLRSEIAKTNEAALTFYKNNSFITFNIFKTKYDDFIELAQNGRQKVDSVLSYERYQAINRDKAYTKGFEINSMLELGEILDKLEGFRIGYKFTHQKGRIFVTERWEDYDGKHSWQGWRGMNAVQPTSHVFNIGYSAPNDKFGIDLFLSAVAAKKPKDSYNSYWRDMVANQRAKNPLTGELEPKGADIVNGASVVDSSWAWRNKEYAVLDAIAYANPSKNFSFSFGIYNITNAKYATWDSLRSIRTFGTTNRINQQTGAGIGRFYAPKRNFKFSWEIKF